MKVCIVTPAFTRQNSKGRGGTETYTEMLAKGLLSKGVEVHVLMYSSRISEDSPPIVPVRLHVLVMKGIPYFSNFFPGLAEAWAINHYLIQLDRIEHFDVIEGMNDEGRMLFVARTFGGRFWMRFLSSLHQHIASKRQSLTWSRRFSVWLDGLAARKSHNLVTHSQSHAQEMALEYQVPAAKINIVPLAVEAPKEVSHSKISQPDSSIERQIVAYIGTLDQRKGIDILLKAIPLILAERPQTRFLIIGRDGGDSPDGSWKDWFEKITADPVIMRQVDFRGFVDDSAMPSLWKSISAVIVPSRYESFGLVVVEAYLRGIPVLISNGGSLPEVAHEAALIFHNGKIDDLSAKALSILEHPEIAGKLKLEGLRIYHEYYTMQRFADRVRRLYQGEDLTA